MTGKEALEEIKNYKIDTTNDCWFRDKETELLCIFPREIITIENELKELAKYKRAFEILKRFLDDEFVYAGFDDGRFIIDGFIDITDEEKELLEELLDE